MSYDDVYKMMSQQAAEIAALRAEIERLKALSQNNAHSWDTIVRERDELRAEIERLRAALLEIAEQAEDADQAEVMARRTLEGK